MCGYTYYFNLNSSKKLDQKRIKDTLNLQRHRGPNFSKYINIDKNHFFHNRLKIIDLSNKANQPMSDSKGNIILFNGEIYNYLELIKKHNLKTLKTKSDTEVILALYDKLGNSFLKELNGIFTFLIFNKKHQQLFIARDRFGVKPLFYYLDKDQIVFSTEIKPILSFIKTIKIDFEQIAEYISNGKYFHTEKTFFKNIKIFPISSFKIINLKNRKILKSGTYWTLNKNKKLICENYQQFYKKFLEKFENALKYNFVSDVEISLMLSSGNDSIFIHDYIKNKTSRNLNCFTYGWNDDRYDEIRRLKKIKLKIKKHHVYKVQTKKIFDNLKDTIYKFEGPVGGFNTLGQYYLFKKIREKNIKVAFSGEGADEFLLGYSIFKNILDKNKNKEGKKFLVDKVHSPDGYELNDNDLIDDHFKTDNKLKKFKNLNMVLDNYVSKVKLPKLLIFYDKASALNGIEGRVPMLDHNLAEFLFSNSPYFRIQKKPIKDYFMKNKISFYKDKLNVSTPQREFFKTKQIVTKVLHLIKNGNLKKLKILNIKKFKKKYDSFLQEKKASNSFFIWKVINAEYFLEAYKNQIK